MATKSAPPPAEAPPDPLAEIAPQLEKAIGEASAKLMTLVKERPGACLLGALALGYIIGRVASRR